MHTKQRKFTAILLVLAMLFTLMPALPQAAEASDEDAYFYVLRPDYSGTLEQADKENFYYVGEGKVLSNVVNEVFDPSGEAVENYIAQEPIVTIDSLTKLDVPQAEDFYSRIGNNFENVTWYRTVYANGANANGDNPEIVPGNQQCWHVDGVASPVENTYQVRFVVPALAGSSHNPLVSTYSFGVGTLITENEIQSATNAANEYSSNGQPVVWYFDETFNQAATPQKIIEKSKQQQSQAVLTIYGKYMPEYAAMLSVEKNLTQIVRDGTPITENLSDATELQVGDQLTWTITVSNDGNEQAGGVKLTDSLNLSVPLNDPDKNKNPKDFGLGYGEKANFIAEYTVTQADAGKTLTNTATVTYQDQTSSDSTSNVVKESEPVNPPEPEQWDTSKSKTATNLDANYESQVTLSLPSAEETLTSDVVFVLDKSSCGDNVTTEALSMLRELNEKATANGATIKVGAVQFAGRATVSCDLTKLTGEAVGEGGAIYDGLKEQKITSGGTNLQAGLLEAQKMLKSDDSVEDNRKYVIVITDGLTRQFLAEDGKLMAIYNAIMADELKAWASPSSWCIANGFPEGQYNIPGGNWTTYWNAVTKNVKVDGDKYASDYDTFGTAPQDKFPDSYVPLGKSSLDNALCLDRALYEAEKVYRDLEDEGYNCFAVFTDEPNTSSNKLGEAFVNFLNNEKTLDFNKIQDEIYYLLGADSKVIDEIGSGTDDKGNAYDFAFVNGIDKLKLTVRGVELDKHDLGNNTYGFGQIDDDSYRFKLTYYEKGSTDNPNEHFVWEINENVSNFAPVQLTYSVKLTDPQTEAGTYGQYDENGSKQYTGLFTNNSATLYPVDSKGTDGLTETFAKPTVSYTVAEQEAITIKPADITIYMGGTGYDGALDEDGEYIPTNESGFPEPGFEITLPNSLKNADMDKLQLQYVDGDTKLTWHFEKYGEGNHNIYRIVPGEGTETRDVRMEFYKTITNVETGAEEELIISEDTFDFEKNLNQTLEMRVYGEGIDQNKVSFVYDPEEEAKEYGIETTNGELTVRGTTQKEDYGDMQNEEDATIKPNEPAVTAEEGTTFTINASPVQVNEQGSNIALLFDEIIEENTVEGNNTELLESRADDVLGSTSDTREYDVKYLDLVERNNGNAWVAASKDVTVYWPLPEGTDKNTEFKLLHFEGLHREMATEDVSDQIDNCKVENVEIEDVTDTHIVFKIGSGGFSPFALVWDTEDDGGNTGGGTTPNPPALNTEDHFSYVVGYPEDYRTGEPSDDEALWPVKPQGNITRAEVASIFYRLLKDEVRDANTTDVSSFSDVEASDWYGTTVATLSAMDIVRGYEDGTFRPNAPITRAEFAAIATRFFEETGAEYEPGTFEDVTGDEWFANAIADAVELGLIGGYPDGTVRPNNNITRAEACAVVNRTLGRIPHVDHLLPADEMRTWPDNNPSDWFYADMQEATNGHEYEWTKEDGQKVEEWTEILDKDWEDR